MTTATTVEHPANIHHSSELISHSNNNRAGSQTIQTGSTFIIALTIIFFVFWAISAMLGSGTHKDNKKRRNSHSHNYDLGSLNNHSADSSSSFSSYDSGSSSCDGGFDGGSSDCGDAGGDF